MNIDTEELPTHTFYPSIQITRVENGYVVSADTPETDADGVVMIATKVSIFQRDVHVIKHLRELLTSLEAVSNPTTPTEV